MSAMPSVISRIGPRSPAACRKAAGTSLVADIARNCITSSPGGRATVDEVLDEPVARAAKAGPELPLDECFVPRQVEPATDDRACDAVGVDDLRADHLGPIVEIEPRVALVLAEVGHEQHDRPTEQRELDDRRR